MKVFQLLWHFDPSTGYSDNRICSFGSDPPVELPSSAKRKKGANRELVRALVATHEFEQFSGFRSLESGSAVTSVVALASTHIALKRLLSEGSLAKRLFNSSASSSARSFSLFKRNLSGLMVDYGWKIGTYQPLRSSSS